MSAVHLLRMPCPVDCLVSWCGEPAARIANDSVVGLDDAEVVDCQACRVAMRDARDAFANLELEERDE